MRGGDFPVWMEAFLDSDTFDPATTGRGSARMVIARGRDASRFGTIRLCRSGKARDGHKDRGKCFMNEASPSYFRLPVIHLSAVRNRAKTIA
ncbi:hypothetical protein [Mesorhizobium sp. B1-1-8]|uniref:hypothetical protein n=1 Tax=Mesorhizobium sp. B1-1-8 TaxID=2589976 RepID=UPI00112D2857|nr:hypothetical protein [Mesorhizobium sp. B1-1-8]UCI08478.1 hypothetical protein FJ974_05240 [Mesorhizobium sp. B1-1-8]